MKSIIINFKIAALSMLIIICTWILLNSYGKSNMIKPKDILADVENIPNSNPSVQVSSLKGNRTKVVFYNRVGKCGSRTLWRVIQALSIQNKFNTSVSLEYGLQSATPSQPDAYKEMKKIAEMEYPMIYNRHIHYLDFEKNGLEPPIYINMIRDPIDRFSSRFNYLKYGMLISKKRQLKSELSDINECVLRNHRHCTSSSNMFYIGLYFCGIEAGCKDKKLRVKIAKKHIDENYLIVGMLEEFENTLRLLEKMLPRYFSQVMQIWNINNIAWHTVTQTIRRDVLTEEAIAYLRKHSLADEIEVYEHAKKKFDLLKKQYGIV